MKILICYHCSFFKDATTPWAMALPIIQEQWELLRSSGLVDAAAEIIIGINGGKESESVAKACFPGKAKLVFHGVESKAENLTLVELEKWSKTHPGWAILYLHSKGISYPVGSHYADLIATPWRRAMMTYLVGNWWQCVKDLDGGYDIACCQWLWGCLDGTQHIPAGNFLWVRSNFVVRLPSIYQRARIKLSGIAALESRHEAEVYWGNGPKPSVKQYLPYGGCGIPQLSKLNS